MQQSLGTIIGAVFGAVFIFANAGDPLPFAVVMALRVLAVVGLIVAIASAVTARRRADAGADTDAPRPPMFGGKYWLIVVIEFAAIFGGAALLRALDAPVHTTIAWVAFVVGVHFIPLAKVWREASILIPAYGLTVLGAVGFAVAFTSAEAWTPIISGVGSGVLFLSGCVFSGIDMIRARSSSKPDPA